MDTEKLFAMLGRLYTRVTLLEEENRQLKLTVQARDEEIGLLRTKERESGQTRVSSK